MMNIVTPTSTGGPAQHERKEKPNQLVYNILYNIKPGRFISFKNNEYIIHISDGKYKGTNII